MSEARSAPNPFQSTPSREGRRRVAVVDPVVDVSIHALARRATIVRDRHARAVRVSIHALARRATISSRRSSQISTGFNPRPRAKGDAGRTVGRTFAGRFNPRPRAKGDVTLPIVPVPVPEFQSTPSREGRPSWWPCFDLDVLVSIHALARRATVAARAGRDRRIVSIHALARRATWCASPCAGSISVSIHALARRATRHRCRCTGGR